MEHGNEGDEHNVTSTFLPFTTLQYDDWVALYAPADADPSKVAPVKFKYAFTCPQHMKEGRGTFR